MIIGILAESSNDSEPLKKILYNILPEDLREDLSFITHESNTGIYADMEKAAKIFFNTEPKCDLAVYLNDLDKQPDRCKKIRLWVKTYCTINVSTKIIVGCPALTFEQWFISEEQTIKSVLKLDPTRALPYAGQHPKTRVENMVYDSPDMTITKKSAYIDIAEKINITVLRKKDKSFEKFYNDFIKILK